MEDLVIDLGDFEQRPVGFIPEKDQKIFVKCNECGELIPIELGQYNITIDNRCPKCGQNFVGLSTWDLFEVQDVFILYSDRVKIHPILIDSRKSIDNDVNIRSSICMSKYIGESFLEEWDLSQDDDPIYKLKNHLDPDATGNRPILIIDTDVTLLCYLYASNCDLTKIYVINKDFQIKKLGSIKIEKVNLTYNEE